MEPRRSDHGTRRIMVSIVVPAYNAERFIRQAVGSALDQTYRDLEVIVVDDGSADRTAEIVRSIEDPRLILLCGPNGGVAKARNRAIEAARGDLIAFLDADDYWYPEKIEHQVAAIAADPSLVAVGTRMRYETETGKLLNVTGSEVKESDRPAIAAGNFMPFSLSSLMVRTDALREIGGFDEGLKEVVGQVEDLDALMKLATLGPMATLPEVLGGYRVHAGGATTRQMHAHIVARRFLQERTAARSEGRDITWAEFSASYRPTIKERLAHRTAAWSRSA
ncbi:MAG: glycosyltransferase family 2 protein, partial [Actinomycetota bacterium]